MKTIGIIIAFLVLLAILYFAYTKLFHTAVQVVNNVAVIPPTPKVVPFNPIGVINSNPVNNNSQTNNNASGKIIHLK